MRHASAASSAGDVDRLVASAEAMADSCFDWRAILKGVAGTVLASRERITEVAKRTLELAIVEHDIWGFRDVAKVRTTRLGDEPGARDALEAGFRAFLEPRPDAIDFAVFGFDTHTQGYMWVLLAEGYIETLQDSAGARHCLEAGVEMSRRAGSAEDLCRIAEAWGQHVDREEGISLLRETEAMSDGRGLRAWTLAYAWWLAGVPEAVRRVLDRAIADARSCSDAVHVLRASSSLHELERVDRAFARAQELAKTANDWLVIGDASFDAALGDGRIREALVRAEALAADGSTRGRISRAYTLWLGDHAEADRVGPRGVRPEFLRRRGATRLDGWEGSASDLWDWLRVRASPAVLGRIARADYGNDAEQHLAALRDVCETGLVPRTLGWVPGEVLELTRWSEGETVDHLGRALSCALLCLAGSQDLETNGPILVESCLALGPEPSEHAQRLFAWFAESVPVADDREGADPDPERTVALVLLFLLRAAVAPDDDRLVGLSRMIVEDAASQLADIREGISESMRRALWNELIDRVLLPHRTAYSHIANLLRGLGR